MKLEDQDWRLVSAADDGLFNGFALIALGPNARAVVLIDHPQCIVDDRVDLILAAPLLLAAAKAADAALMEVFKAEPDVSEINLPYELKRNWRQLRRAIAAADPKVRAAYEKVGQAAGESS